MRTTRAFPDGAAAAVPAATRTAARARGRPVATERWTLRRPAACGDIGPPGNKVTDCGHDQAPRGTAYGHGMNGRRPPLVGSGRPRADGASEPVRTACLRIESCGGRHGRGIGAGPARRNPAASLASEGHRGPAAGGRASGRVRHGRPPRARRGPGGSESPKAEHGDGAPSCRSHGLDHFTIRSTRAVAEPGASRQKPGSEPVGVRSGMSQGWNAEPRRAGGRSQIRERQWPRRRRRSCPRTRRSPQGAWRSG